MKTPPILQYKVVMNIVVPERKSVNQKAAAARKGGCPGKSADGGKKKCCFFLLVVLDKTHGIFCAFH
ncbi:hypothetical protein [Anaerotignum sp.]|uniref:hypothetical protein n=1 Tax=Anaerotignum sp. TaxID=2039241 RepID=UPI003993EA2B